jgi:hypothetical protein
MIRILGLMCLLLGASLVSAEPIQWPIAEGGNDHWYEAIDINDGVTRAEANSHAISLGGVSGDANLFARGCMGL